MCRTLLLNRSPYLCTCVCYAQYLESLEPVTALTNIFSKTDLFLLFSSSLLNIFCDLKVTFVFSQLNIYGKLLSIRAKATKSYTKLSYIISSSDSDIAFYFIWERTSEQEIEMQRESVKFLVRFYWDRARYISFN